MDEQLTNVEAKMSQMREHIAKEKKHVEAAKVCHAPTLITPTPTTNMLKSKNHNTASTLFSS